jgi:uncharacterized protein (TIGR02001 family)
VSVRLRCAAWLVAVLLPCAAVADPGQLAASVTLESDNRLRGVSLNDQRPALRLGLGYDHPSGWFAGASAANARLEGGEAGVELVGSVGRAWRTGGGPSWELGTSAAHFSADAGYDYVEAFGGVTIGPWNARLSISPDYFGRHVRTAYAELNGAFGLGDGLRLFGHLGALGRLGGAMSGPAAQRGRQDAQLGVGLRVQAWDLQLAASARNGGPGYPALYETRRRAVVLSASLLF